jgi:D-hydroxyproline dehydrogenase
LSASVKTALVVGNGLIGACIALELQRAGVRVTVLDVGDERAAASFGNAGHLATEQVVPLASRDNVRSLASRLFIRGGPVGLPPSSVAAWLPFGLKLLRASSPDQLARGTQAMQGLLGQAIVAWQRVAALIEAPGLIRADGHFVVWESADSASRGLAAWQLATHQGVGANAAVNVREATEEECQSLRSRFAGRVAAAARFSGTGQVTDLRALRKRLQAAFEQAGGVVRRARVARILPQAGEVVLVEKTQQGQQHLKADTVVVAAGIGSAALLQPLGCAAPLIAERGYHVEQAWGDGAQGVSPHAITTPQGLPVVFEDRSVIIAPLASSLRISSFTEFAKHDAPPDPRKWQRLAHHANELGLYSHPPAAPHLGVPLQRWIGSRPTLPDYLPALGQHPRHARVFYAFGHNHLGVTLAAITGALMSQLVMGQPRTIDLKPFDLQRFA